jgi:hypothetical protein
MLLQLTGRLDPGETYAIVSLEGADLVAHSAPPSLDYAEFELVNIVICQVPEHNHFGTFPPTANYPMPEGVWSEKITIKVPRPLPLVHRRRTRFFTFPDDPVPSVKRVKRAPPTTAKIVTLTDYQVEYRARFSNPTVVCEINNIQNATLTRIINQLKGQFRTRIEKHFQRLLLDLPIYEFDTTESTRRNLYKVKITLPPLTRQTCSNKEIWILMGLENYIVEVGGAGDKKWGLVNTSKTENRSFLSDTAVETMTILGAVSMMKKTTLIAETIYFYFERHPFSHPNTYLNFDEHSLCLQNPTATAYFFQTLVDCVVQQSYLPTHSLRITQTVENSKTFLRLTKAASIDSTDDTPNNFTIYARFGSEIMEKLGLKSPTIILPINGSIELNTIDEESEEETALCQLVMDKLMKEQFYNQTGGVAEVTAIWRRQWKTIVQQRQRETEAGEAAADELRRVQKIKADEVERQRQQKLQAEAELERQRLLKIQTDEAAAVELERKRIDALKAAAAAAERQPEESEEETERRQKLQDAALELERQRLDALKASEAATVELERQRLQKIKDDAAEAERQQKLQAEAELERQRLQKIKDDAAAAEVERQRQQKIKDDAAAAAELERQRLQKIKDDAAAAEVERQRQQKIKDDAAAAELERQRLQKIKDDAAAAEEERVENPGAQQPEVEEEEQEAGGGGEPADDPPVVEQEVEIEVAGEQEEEAVDPPIVEEEAEGGEQEVETEAAAGGEQEEEAEAAGGEQEEEAEAAGGGGDAEGGEEMPPQEEEEEGGEEMQEEENSWMEIEIDNPQPRPTANFLVANSIRPHICTPPNSFPAYCTLLIKEGEPVDYISQRGACSILGIIRNRQPNIYTNKCIVKNVKNMKHIAIEFVDEAFNTFKIAADSPSMWIKLDLRTTKNVYY